MGLRILDGIADGTRRAAAMYCSTSGWMIGPLFEAEDAVDQIEAFCAWLKTMEYVSACSEIGLTSNEMPFVGRDGTDPRDWGDRALEKLVSFWKLRALDEDGMLRSVGVT